MYRRKKSTSVSSCLLDPEERAKITVGDKFFRYGLPIEMYVDQDEMGDFTCEICFGVYKDPLELVPCNHAFCKNCVSEFKQKSQENQQKPTCPKCRKDYFFEHNLEDLKQVIDNQKVYCPLKVIKGKTCSWVGKMAEIESHMNKDCEFCPGKCDCGQIMERYLYNSPDYQCECPELPCDFCGFKLSLRLMEKHIDQCDEAIFTHTCGELIRRKDLKLHELNYCTAYDPLVPCPYYNQGCTEKIPKSQLKQHEEDFRDYHKMISECKLIEICIKG